MNRFRLGVVPLALAAAFGASAVRADDAPFDGRFYLTPAGTYTLADRNRGTDNGFGGALAIGKRVTKGLELELLGGVTFYDTRQGDFSTPQPNTARAYGLGVGANIYLFPSAQSVVRGLFVHADVQRGWTNSQPGPVSDYTTTLFDAGLGWDFPLPITLGGLLPPGVALRTEALYHLDADNRAIIGTNTDAAYGHTGFTEVQFDIGLRIPIGGYVRPAAEAPPEPPAVVPLETAPPPPPEPPPAPPPPPCQPPAPGQPISLEGCKTGDVIVLRGVNFDFNQATLTVNAKALLDQVADALLARKDIKVEIDGYTDGRGAAAYNLKLSDRRAASVRQYLVGRGIDAARMSSKGFGKTMPIADNNTDEGRELNRRVELKVTESAAGVETPAAEAAPSAAADSMPMNIHL